jgi:hypothetical protein
MKLQFNANLEYQAQAVASVVDLFRGQTPMQSNFTVTDYAGQTGLLSSANGISNKLEIDEEDILANLQEFQLRNGLPQTKSLKANHYDFERRWRQARARPMFICAPSLSYIRIMAFQNLSLSCPALQSKRA